MDKNTSLERRFSLSTTHIPSPIAESTCLNFNGTNMAAQFHWGGTPISPNHRSNSSMCLSNSQSAATTNANFSLNTSNTGGISPQRSTSKMVDARVYADVQSKGLVSRVVKYHENVIRLNRSASVNSIYNKPGQFPVVHLKKHDLPYKAATKNLSMTRIAPPEKSMFYGNTLPSILRSNSIVGLQKTDEEISRENRPILHPPPTENELAPTRSVLEVLKEISRKRINNDDLNSTEVSKKYCSRENIDVVDTNQSDLNRNANGTQSYKRQREPSDYLPSYQPAPKQSQQTNVMEHYIQHNHNHQQQQQISPEQVAKKRLYNYNNDISSSLSSSRIHTNKRKLYDQKLISSSPSSSSSSSPLSTNLLSLRNSSSPDDYEYPRAKIQRHQSDLRFEQLSNTLSCHIPITPLPTTPLVNRSTEEGSCNMTSTSTSPSLEISNAAEQHSPTATTVHADPSINKITLPSPAKTNKHKLTLFNKNCDDNKERKVLNNETLEDDVTSIADHQKYSGIPFVKPRNPQSMGTAKNPLIEKTQKSKLALMLSGLRGELYQGSGRDDVADEIDAAANKKSENLNKTATSTLSSSSTTVTANLSLTSNTIKSTSTTVPSLSTTTSAAAPIPKISTTTTTTTTAIATALPTTTTTTAKSVGGFKFTPPTTTTTSATAVISPIKPVASLVGIKLTPQTVPPASQTVPSASTAAAATSITQALAPSFSFGAPTTATTTTAAVTKAVSTLPQLTGFSFGANTINQPLLPSTTSKTTAPTAGTSSKAVGGFAFGTVPNVPSTLGATAPTFGSFGNAQTTNASFAFGSSGSSVTATTTTASTAATATTIIPTFGSMSAATSTMATGSSFGGIANTNTAATPSATGTLPKAFSFGPTSATPVGNVAFTSNSNKPFAFAAPTASANTTTTTGVAATVTTSTTTTAPGLFAFGTAAPSTGGLSFGSTPSAAPIQKPSVISAPFLFGGGGGGGTGSANMQNSSATTTTTTGMSSSMPTAATKTSAFAFNAGASASTNNPLSFGSSSTNNTNAFAFGGAATGAGANASSIFGQVPNVTNSSTATTTTANAPSSFTFNSSNAQQNTEFGGGAGGLFSTTNTTNAPAAAPGPSPFAFGKTDKGAAGGFSFAGSVANAQNSTPAASSTNFFNNAAAANPLTGVVKPSFSFGGAGTSNATLSNGDAGKSLFGGAMANNDNASTNSNNNTFGALAQSKSFAFGSNALNNNAPSTNLFGSISDTNKLGGGGGGGAFSFGSAAASAQQQQQQQNTQNKPPSYAFVAANNLGGNNTNATVTSTPVAAPGTATPFAFGGANAAAATAVAASAAQADPANKLFSFGSTASAPRLNMFGGTPSTQQTATNAPTPQQNPAGTFTFGPIGGAAGAVAPPNGNIFAPSPTPDRPIRKATRRLTKTTS